MAEPNRTSLSGKEFEPATSTPPAIHDFHDMRGKVGVVAAYRGSHVFPDTAAHDQGENAQPLYTVRFEATDLCGDNVQRRDCVYIDLWEDYLTPATSRSPA
jgi:nitrile hydratase beta subunit-like protein